MSTSEGILGIRERFIEAEESTYGSAVSLASAKIPGYDVLITPEFEQGFQEILSDGSDVRTIADQVAGPLILNYDLEFTPVDWQRLKYVFDIDSETGSDPYTHNLSIGNTLKSYTAEWALRHDSAPIIIKLTGNVVKSTTISFQKSTGEGRDAFIRVIQKCIAQNYSTPSIEAGSFTVTGDPFQYRHNAWTLNTSAVVEVNSGTIVIDQVITDGDSRYADTSLGRTIGAPIPTLCRISGTFNVTLLDTTYMDLWETADAISGTNTIAFTKSASDKATFTLTGMHVNPIPLSQTNIEGVNTADFVFTATSISCVAIDSIANW